VHLYFEFLTTYTRSLLPLSVISAAFYLFSPTDSYPPLFALVLCLYSTIFVAYWRIRERKLAVRWGTRGCESVAVGRLRPEYVANLGLDKRAAATGPGGEEAVDAVQAGHELQRDVKVALSVPVIVACGVGLGVVLMGIFLLEAFVAQVYQGAGKEVVVSGSRLDGVRISHM
jgi:anoctamin-10